jgi:phage repressor protein C with HTH and peptisase S24 domain
MGDVRTPSMYDTLMRLKPDGLTPNAWALKAGVNRNVFNDVRTRGHLKLDTLEKLLDAAGVSLAQYEAEASPIVATEVAAAGLPTAAEVRHAFRGETPLPAIPVLGTVIAGEHGDLDQDIELVELHLSEVLDYKARPASLSGDPRAYGVNILTDSMAPKFEPGETIAVTPKATVSIRDYVVVQLRGAEGDDERVKMVLVKRLVRRTADYVELCQFNPEKTFRIDARRVVAMHKVAGTLF